MRTWVGIAAVSAVLLAAPVPATADWQAGVDAFKAGNLSQAAQEFQAVVDQQPDWPGGHYMLGQVLLKQKKNQDALTHLRKAYDLNPNDVAYQLVLGKAYLATGRYSDASQLLGGINASSLPKTQQAALYQMMAVAHDKTGQTGQAQQALAQAAAANPNDAGIQYQYGTTAFNNGDTGVAVSALAKAVSLDSGDARKRETYIKALIRQGRENRGAAKDQAYQKAVGEAQKLAAADGSYDNLLLLGEAQLGANDYKGAVSTFGQASSKNAADWLPLYYTGQAHTAIGTYDQAEASLKQALTKTTAGADQVRIYKQLGFVYEKKRDFEGAKNAYGKAGDQAAVQRVAENQQIQEFNKDVEQEAAKIQEIEAERKRLEEELKELPGGAPPPN